MGTKVITKSGTHTPFGGIFYVIEQFNKWGLGELIDEKLGIRTQQGYLYSEIFSNIFSIFLCGGTCIEDIERHLGCDIEQHPHTRAASADTLLRGIKELSEENVSYTSDRGVSYDFNINKKLNKLLLDMLLHSGQLKPGLYDFDFDHQFIPTEKRDTKYSYKGARGYFPGVATINGCIVGIENRDGNTNVRFHQAETLVRIFRNLYEHGILVDRCRMDFLWQMYDSACCDIQ